MDLSIIITNYKKADLLPVCLRLINWAKEDYEIEVIIIDDHSDENYDNCQAIVKAFQQNEKENLLKDIQKELDIQLYGLKERSKTLSYIIPLNVGIKKATGKYIMFLPSDTAPITSLRHVFQEHQQHDGIHLYAELIHIPFSFTGTPTFPSFAGSTLKTEYARLIGGFNEDVIGAHGAFLDRLIRDTGVTHRKTSQHFKCLHFVRELHPGSFPERESTAPEIAYEKEMDLIINNPMGWGSAEAVRLL